MRSRARGGRRQIACPAPRRQGRGRRRGHRNPHPPRRRRQHLCVRPLRRRGGPALLRRARPRRLHAQLRRRHLRILHRADADAVRRRPRPGAPRSAAGCPRARPLARRLRRRDSQRHGRKGGFPFFSFRFQDGIAPLSKSALAVWFRLSRHAACYWVRGPADIARPLPHPAPLPPCKPGHWV